MRNLILTLLLLALPAASQVFRHGRFQQAFTASQDHPDPLSVRLTVDFRSPAGQTLTVNGFWDGARAYKVRFSPEQSGQWTWRSNSSDPDMDALTGRFTAAAYQGSNELYLRGAPRISPGARYFTHPDNTPWFWLACTGWNSAILSTDEEWKQYLADRKAKRFTAIQFILHAPWRAGRQDENGNVAFTPSPLAINPAFFQRMDRKLDQLNDAGLVGVPVLLWALTSKDNESPGAALPDEDAAQLASYMVARYGAHHVLWLLGGDGNFAGPNAQRWRNIGRAVFPADRPRRPVSLHPGGMRDPWPDLKDEPWLDFLTYQTGHGSDQRKWQWNARAGTALGWSLSPPRPALDAEPNYEGHLSYQAQHVIDDADVRRAAYYSLLAATPAGITYGAHGIWWWGRKKEIPLDHPRTGEALPWFECLNYPGAQQMKILRDIFDSFSWWTLHPDRTLIASRSAEPDYLKYPVAAWSPQDKFALFYLPDIPNPKLNLSRFPRPRLTWIDPRTGNRLPGKPDNIQPPSAGDWLLLVR
jgi:hypothetical protein